MKTLLATGMVLGCALLVAGCSNPVLDEIVKLKDPAVADAAKCGFEPNVLKQNKCDKVKLECTELHSLRAKACHKLAAAGGSNASAARQRTLTAYDAGTATLPTQVEPKLAVALEEATFNALVGEAEAAIMRRTGAPDNAKPPLNERILAAANQLNALPKPAAAKNFARYYRAEVLANTAALLPDAQQCAPLSEATALLKPQIVDLELQNRVGQLQSDITSLRSSAGCT